MNFTLDLVDDQLPKLVQETINGKRHYHIEGQQVYYPSVTTVISSCKKTKKALFEWRERVGEAQANKISRQASSRGTAVHKLIEDYVLGSLDTSEMMPIHLDMFSKLREVADERIGSIKLIEGRMLSNHLRVSGTVDMIAEFDGVMSVIDWKTSAKEKKRDHIHNYFKQESAYAVMFEENLGIAVPQLVTVITNQMGSAAQVFIEKRNNWIGEFIKLRDQYESEI